MDTHLTAMEPWLDVLFFVGNHLVLFDVALEKNDVYLRIAHSLHQDRRQTIEVIFQHCEQQQKENNKRQVKAALRAFVRNGRTILANVLFG